MADDLHRFLNGEPIKARPATVGRRGVKWARRRPVLAAMLAAMASSIVVAIVSLIAAVVEAHAAESAEAAAPQGRRGEPEERSGPAPQHRGGETAFGLPGGPGHAGPGPRPVPGRRRGPRPSDAGGRAATGGATQQRRPGLCGPRQPGGLAALLPQPPLQAAAPELDHDRGLQWRQSPCRHWQPRPDGPSLGRRDRCSDHSALEAQGAGPAVAFHPNGGSLLTGCGNAAGQARLWDAATGKAIGVPLPHEAPVLAVAYTPDGKRILTMTPRQVQFWDTATSKPIGQPLRTRPDPSKRSSVPTAAAWRRAAATARPSCGTARPANPGRGPAFAGEVLAVAFSPDGAIPHRLGRRRGPALVGRHGEDARSRRGSFGNGPCRRLQRRRPPGPDWSDGIAQPFPPDRPRRGAAVAGGAGRSARGKAARAALDIPSRSRPWP